ncbi:MAG: hypothetical protein MK132_00545 [Lentisphaerales bacterium]|nr:hypothetical protein [Lentisphaerales bacterium]
MRIVNNILKMTTITKSYKRIKTIFLIFHLAVFTEVKDETSEKEHSVMKSKLS